MKREDVVIEIYKDVSNEIFNICENYGLDLEHLPFKKFKIKEIHKNIDEYFNKNRIGDYKQIAQERGLLNGIGDSEFEKIMNNFKKNLSEGSIFSVEVIDKTIYIEDEIGKIKMEFEDSILEPGWRKNATFNLEFSTTNKRFEEGVVKTDGGGKAISLIVIKVMSILTYLQIPNKSKEVQKTSRIDVENKKSKSKKKKSSKQSKTYIYKTTYHIDNIADNIDLEETRSYKRKTEEWIARGHWRTLRDGRKIWIKESVRKSKIPVSNNPDNTTKGYKITKVDL